MGRQVFGFGDARRIGLRAVNVYRSDLEEGLTMVGRYDEPRLVSGLVLNGSRILILGENQNLLQIVDSGLVPEETQLPVTAEAAAFLADGRWVAAEGKWLYIEDVAEAAQLCCPVRTLAVDGDQVVAAHSDSVSRYDTASGMVLNLPLPSEAVLPPVLAIHEEDIYLAAPEWESSLRIGEVTAEIPPHLAFGTEEIMDVSLWWSALPRRVLLDSDFGLIEAAGVGRQAGLALHAWSGGTKRIPLPDGNYVAGVVGDARSYLLSMDRNAYRSMILTVRLDGLEPEVAAIESFTGVGTAMALQGSVLYVADADIGIRLYETVDDALVLTGLVALKEAP